MCALVTRFIYYSSCNHMPPWRNRLARSAVNRKVGGSSPPGGEYLFNFLLNKNEICFNGVYSFIHQLKFL